MAKSTDLGDDIAIVGMACRFPGSSNSPEELWNTLSEGRSGFSPIPASRFNLDGWYHPDPERAGSCHIRGAHFLDGDIASFDARLFSISGAEATSMDPQQRILLEVAFEAFENAGIPVEALKGSRTGVWCGCFVQDYEHTCLRDPDTAPPYAATGNAVAILANRVSHAFDLAGTSQTIDTGCSASMIAVHQACQSLLSGESSMAVAAGVGLIYSPNTLIPMGNLKILSPDGKCFTLDHRANGYGRGEGVGVVVLKRLSDALAQNDTIRAVIRGTGTNQDGRTQGITLPSKQRQIANMQAVYDRAGLNPRDTAYFELHGTGTRVGDCKETSAVSTVFCSDRDVTKPLVVGAVKTNLGHLEGAAGVAGLIKTVLVVEKGYIPKNLNFEKSNPDIDLQQLKLQVPLEMLPWPVEGLRRASVNSFGFGGTNAHLIVEDALHHLAERGLRGNHDTYLYPRDPLQPAHDANTDVKPQASSANVPAPFRKQLLFVFSCHYEGGLCKMLAQHSEYVQDKHRFSCNFLADFAYTLLSRRSKLEWRTFCVAGTSTDLAQTLAAGSAMSKVRARDGSSPQVALIFSGQGAQWAQMGQELAHYAVFKDSIREASKYLEHELHSPFNLWQELFRDKSTSRINGPEISQPATTALQIALIDLLRACNMQPSAVVGHSSGEVAAAYACGALKRQDAWKIAYHRGRCVAHVQATSKVKGAMLAVFLSEPEAQRYITCASRPGSVVVACVNSPTFITISGDEDQIHRIKLALDVDNVRAVQLKVNTAYHSHHMTPADEMYRKALASIQPNSVLDTTCTMYSSLKGGTVQAKELDAEYWVQNLIHQVKFRQAVEAMLEESNLDILLEVGPHHQLQPALQQIALSLGTRYSGLQFLSMLHRNQDASMTMLTVMGHLWATGYPVSLDWMSKNHDENLPRMLSDLPRYPFDRSKTYWSESHLSEANRFRTHGREDLIGAPLENSTLYEPRWRGFFRLQENPWMEDHKVQGSILYPAGGMLAMAIEGAKQRADLKVPVFGYEVSDFEILKPMMIPHTPAGLEHMLSMRLLASESTTNPFAATVFEFSILSRPSESEWLVHARGRVSIHYDSANTPASDAAAAAYVEQFRRHFGEGCDTKWNPRQFYESLEVIGMTYGPLFRNIVELRCGSRGAACSVIRVPDTKAKMPNNFEFDHVIHPATIDTMLQTVFAIDQDPMLPCAIDSIFVRADVPVTAGSLFRGYATARKARQTTAQAEIVMFDNGLEQPKVVIKGLQLKAVPVASCVGGASFLPAHRNLCSELVWKEALSTAKPLYVQEMLDLLGHQRPGMHILHLGVSLACTKEVLGALTGADQTPRFSTLTSCCSDSMAQQMQAHYTSSGFEEQLEFLGDEAKALSQRQYDLIVIGSDEVPSTAILGSAVKQGGWLLHKPLSDVPRRNSVTLASLERQFSLYWKDPGTKHIIASCNKPIASETTSFGKVLLLVPDEPSQLSQSMIAKCCDFMHRSGVSPDQARLSTCHTLHELTSYGTCVSFLEIDSPRVFDLDQESFDMLQRILLATKNVLWISCGGQASVEPKAAVFVGLARSLRSEDAQRNIVAVDVGHPDAADEYQTMSVLFDILRTHFGCTDDAPENNETEIVVRHGRVYIPRLRPITDLNRIIEQGHNRAHSVHLEPMLQRRRPLQFSSSSVEGLDGLLFEQDFKTVRQLEPDEVDIIVESTTIDARDLALWDHENTSSDAGTDVNGTVCAVGSTVNNVSLGDTVIALVNGTLKDVVRVKNTLVRAMPTTRFRTTQTTRWCLTAYVSALHGLHNIGHLGDGQTVLILGAASASGQAALQLAQFIGGRVQVFAGYTTEQQRSFLRYVVGVPDAFLVDVTSDAAVSSLRARTGHGEGVDVVFNPTAHHIDVCLQAVCDFGHIAQISTRNAKHSQPRLMDKNVHFEAFDIATMVAKRPQMVEKLLLGLDVFFRTTPNQGGLRTLGVFDFTNFKTAFEQLRLDPYLGINTLEITKSTRVPVAISLTTAAVLDPAATYVLVGGLGGIGRSIADCLVKKGAKYLAFLSRSGPRNQEALECLAKLKEQGAFFRAYNVDISNRQELESTLRLMSYEMPPIKGAVQCAAVLSDTSFSTMSFADWHKALAPKATGSWNLHELLPRDMDFMVFLSSSSGIIGNRGQANYAAGNCFQDALARYRTSIGQYSVSLDLGLVLSAGMVADDEQLLGRMRAAGFFGTRLKDVLFLLERALKPYGSERFSCPAQIVTAVGTGGLNIQNNVVDPFWMKVPMFSYLKMVDNSPGEAASAMDKSKDLATMVQRASSTEAAKDMIYTSLVSTLSRRKGMAPSDFDAQHNFSAYGIDSLDSIFMISWISRTVGVTVQSLEEKTIGQLCQELATNVLKTQVLQKV